MNEETTLPIKTAPPKQISLTIDGMQATVPEETTMIEAAASIGIRIPRLCYHPDLSLVGSCRVCLVEVKGLRNPCRRAAFPVWEGMKVRPTPRAAPPPAATSSSCCSTTTRRTARPASATATANCRTWPIELGVRERLFEGERKHFPVDASRQSVVRNPEKCILCGRCVRVCAEIQGVSNRQPARPRVHTPWSRPAHVANMDRLASASSAASASTSAPRPRSWRRTHTERGLGGPADPGHARGGADRPVHPRRHRRGLRLPPGTPATGKLVTALRRLGFDEVFDTNFGADLTIIEEAHGVPQPPAEGREPAAASPPARPGWVNFMEKFYPELIPPRSTCKSPMSMLSTLIKTYYAEKKGIDPKKISTWWPSCPAWPRSSKRPAPEHTHGLTARPTPTPCSPPAS